MSFGNSKTLVNEIKNETTPGANTATRVGDALLTLITDAENSISPQEFVFVHASEGDDENSGSYFEPFETLDRALEAVKASWESVSKRVTIVLLGSGQYTGTINHNNKRNFKIIAQPNCIGNATFNIEITESINVYSDFSTILSFFCTGTQGTAGENAINENTAGGGGGPGQTPPGLILYNCMCNEVSLIGGSGGHGGNANGDAEGGSGGGGANGGNVYLMNTYIHNIVLSGGGGGSGGSGSVAGQTGNGGDAGQVYGFGCYFSASASAIEPGVVQTTTSFMW